MPLKVVIFGTLTLIIVSNTMSFCFTDSILYYQYYNIIQSLDTSI